MHNDNKKNLAIIIPAYKAKFFEKTLDSLAAQTCKDFTVYVGVDKSPDDFTAFVNAYPEINIEFTFFKDNIGGKDLVTQWERCIDLSEGEPWIWLFSDDDVLEPNCVEYFYKTINENPNIELVHFDVNVIDSSGAIVQDKRYKKSNFPLRLTAKEYAKERLQFKLNSFVVEYVFRRDVFMRCGRFQRFDLAWGSDDATWVKMSLDKGIFTTEGARVLWRLSDCNITPSTHAGTMIRKLSSVVEYLNFLDCQFHDKTLERLYYWYYIHALYNAMKICEWPDILKVINRYKHDRRDYIPIFLWRIIFNFVHL